MNLALADDTGTDGAPCVRCFKARITHTPHGTGRATTHALEKLHVDLAGPFDRSVGGALHFMSALDDWSEMGFATPLKTKADAGAALRDWITHLERQTGKTFKRIRCDGAGELIKSTEMIAYFQKTEIRVEPTAPYSPQMNGKADRLNHTILA